MRLPAKVLLVVIPLSILPLLVLGWLAYQQLQETGVERTSDQMETLLSQLTDNFKDHVRVAEANVNLFSNSSMMRNYALTEDEEERYLLVLPSLLNLFKSYLIAFPDYYEIRFLLPDGYEDARMTIQPIPNMQEEEGETPFFKVISQSEQDVNHQIFRNPDNGEISLQIARRVKLRNPATDDPFGTKPRLRGYLVVTMELDFLASQIYANKVGRSGRIFAVDDNGIIVFHQNINKVGKQVSPGVFEKIRTHDHTKFESLYENSLSFISLKQIHPNLHLVGILPKSELLEESRSLGQKVIVVIIIATLFTVIAIMVAVQKLIISPLNKLVNAVDEIGSGQLNPSIDLSTADEMGQLALSFKEMGGKLQRSREQIEHVAYHDSLTGLPNRRLFREYLDRMIALARREENQMAVLFLDLDNFKRVNDTLGHDIGDLLLKEMSTRLMSVLRTEDIIFNEQSTFTSELLARLGGDEFIILLPRVNDSNDVATVAQRILELMKEPFNIGGHELFNGTSIGITLFPNDATEVNDLIKRADVAMYHAKDQGRNNFQFYSDAYNQSTTRRLSLETRLRRAIDNEELEVYYQPQMGPELDEIAGFEALLRWNDPVKGLIMPDSFISLAEDTGLIIPIGEWVLRESCRQLKAWHEKDLTRGFISVNVSGIQLQRQSHFSAMVDLILNETGLEHRYLDLEVTETILMNLKQGVMDQLEELKAAGVAISLDDFGTGYSSLSRLRDLPFAKLKIDRSFVKNMTTEPQDAAIVSATLYIAKRMELLAVAEGVETEDQAKSLKAQGCDLFQGYLFSRPVPASDAEKLLLDYHQQTELKIC